MTNYFEKALKSYKDSLDIPGCENLILNDSYRKKEFKEAIKNPRTISQKKEKQRFLKHFANMKRRDPGLEEETYYQEYFEIEKDYIKAVPGVRGSQFEKFIYSSLQELTKDYKDWVQIEEQIEPKNNNELEILDFRITLKGYGVICSYAQTSLTGGGAQGNRSRKYTDSNFHQKIKNEFGGTHYISLVLDSPEDYGKTENSAGRKLLKRGIDTNTIFWPIDLFNLVTDFIKKVDKNEKKSSAA